MSFCALVDGGKTKEAKLLLRESMEAGQRLTVWKKILEVRSAGCPQLDTAALYWDTVDTCYGTRTLDTGGARARLPGCVDTAHVPAYSLSAEGAARVARLVTVLAYNCPDIPHLPLVFPAAALLLVAGAGEEEAYEVISMMVAPPPAQNINYFTQTRGGWDVLCFSLKPLAQKYIKGSISFLESEFGAEQCEELLQNWPWWIFQDLDEATLLRVMDCFLFEGHKVLFRVALAKLKLFYKAVSAKGELHQAAKKDGLHSAFSSQPVTADQLLKVAFKFPRFSKADIAKLTAKLDMEAKANRLKRAGRRTRSSEDVSDTTRSRAAAFSTPQHRPAGAYPIHHLVSELLSKEQLLAIWDELPERIISVKPTLAYSSNEHGVSLTTFFNRVDKYEPTILVIRTSEMEVFGAYCSTSWAQRNQKDDKGMRQRYFGTGETFLFKFSKSSMLTKYEWVNKDQSDDEEAEEAGGRRRDRAKELFMSADNTMVTVGGGGGTAIYLDENIRFGQTEKCDTFENTPLCSSRDFSINAIEVFGFVDISW